MGTGLKSNSGLESKSSDLDVLEPGGSATAPFPKLKSWTPADTFVVPENLCFSTYLHVVHPYELEVEVSEAIQRLQTHSVRTYAWHQ